MVMRLPKSYASPNRVVVFHGCSTAAVAFCGNYYPADQERELEAGGLN